MFNYGLWIIPPCLHSFACEKKKTLMVIYIFKFDLSQKGTDGMKNLDGRKYTKTVFLSYGYNVLSFEQLRIANKLIRLHDDTTQSIAQRTSCEIPWFNSISLKLTMQEHRVTLLGITERLDCSVPIVENVA